MAPVLPQPATLPCTGVKPTENSAGSSRGKEGWEGGVVWQVCGVGAPPMCFAPGWVRGM